MKLLIYLSLILLLAVSVFSYVECTPQTEPTDIPCQITSTWNYTTCVNVNVTVYNSSGRNVANYTFTNLSNSGFCYFIWNITTKGSYSFYISNGDTGNIIIKVDNMQIGLIIGLGIVIALMMFLAFKLDESHGLLKILLIFLSISLVILIPSVFIIDDSNIIFHKAIMIFQTIFWLYTAAYIVWWIFQKMQRYVPK